MAIVRCAADLERLSKDRRVNGLLVRDSVEIRVPGLAVHDQIRFESALKRYQSRCGCVAATLAFLASIAVGTFWALAAGEPGFSWRFLGAIAVVLVGSMVAAMVAKLIAMQITRIQFSNTCRSIGRQLAGSIMTN